MKTLDRLAILLFAINMALAILVLKRLGPADIIAIALMVWLYFGYDLYFDGKIRMEKAKARRLVQRALHRRSDLIV